MCGSLCLPVCSVTEAWRCRRTVDIVLLSGCYLALLRGGGKASATETSSVVRLQLGATPGHDRPRLYPSFVSLPYAFAFGC